MKRIICLLITLSMLISVTPVMAEEGLVWKETKEGFPIMPLDNYYSRQNSPSFCWPYVSGATYEIVLTSDKDMKNIAYREENLKYNVFTFPYTLEADKLYYWSIRYKIGEEYSEWLAPRRIYIDPNALIFVSPDISKLSEAVSKPKPILLSERKIEAIKKIDQTTKGFIDFKKSVDVYVDANDYDDGHIRAIAASGDPDENAILTPARRINSAALMFYVTRDEKYLNYALKAIEVVKDIDPSSMFVWSPTTDTAEMNFSLALAQAYDMLYNYMDTEHREMCVKILESVLKRPFEGHAKSANMEGSLYQFPFGSHPWVLANALIAGLTIYNESELARKLVDFHLPMLCFTTNMNSQSLQDGGSHHGMFYGLPSETGEQLLSVTESGVANFNGKAQISNAMIPMLYQWPVNWVNSVGDSYNGVLENVYQGLVMLNWHSANDPNELLRGYAKWMLKQGNSGKTQYYHTSVPGNLFSNANEDTQIIAPDIMPDSHYFWDTGVIGMHSDIKDPERVGMTFRSTWYGSNSHAHPDQNSFVIQAYGEDILIDSDYYIVMGDDWDVNYNRKTWAHNTITYDYGNGQPMLDITAKGRITDFIDHRDFKLASGDANKAYEAFDKFQRDIIYITPDIYIIIDDLKAKGDNEHRFESIINTRGDIDFYNNKKGVTISQGKAVVDVTPHYPNLLKKEYIDILAGPDLKEATPYDSLKGITDKRMYFYTKKTNATKMVTTLDVHRAGTDARKIVEEEFKDYMKLSFEDGSICYVNLTDKAKIATKDGITFSGRAFIYNSESVMLVNGTYLSINGKKIFTSDVPVSFAQGKEEVSLSALNGDAKVKFAVSAHPGKFIHQEAINYVDINEDELSAGMKWNYKDGYVTADLYQTYYRLYTAKREMPGKPGSGVIKVIVDGVTNEVPFDAFYDIDGKLTYTWYIEGFNGLHKIEGINDMSFMKAQVGDVVNISNEMFAYINGENPVLELTSVGSNKFETVITDDQTEMEALLVTKIKADQYTEGGEGTTVKFWTDINGNTLQNFTIPMQQVTYEFDVPEDGKYDFALSLSTVSNMTSTKALFINDNIGTFFVPETTNFKDLQGLRVKCGAEFKKGKQKVTIMNMDDGRCIFDWVGLIKCAE